MLKIELKKQIVIKHSNENIKKFEVKHILYCDHIQSKGKNTLLLYCGYSFKDKNIIDARDEHMKYQFIKSDNCGSGFNKEEIIFKEDNSLCVCCDELFND